MPIELDLSKMRFGTELLKRGFAKMQKGGVIMDVVNAEQARIAETAGAVAVMALERVPADIRAAGGVARMADTQKIQDIMDAVTIPVMAKCRIGHFVEAQALESLGVDMIDESEVLTPADPFFHVDKRKFKVPFVCGARNLGEAVRRIWEGAAMIRTKGEAGTGNVVEAVRHQRLITSVIRSLREMDEEKLREVATYFVQPYCDATRAAKQTYGMTQVSGCSTASHSTLETSEFIFDEYTYGEIIDAITKLLLEIKRLQRLPVVNFAAGGIATPADAALMMQLGSDGVFVGSGIFKSDQPEARGKAIVDAVAHFDQPEIIAEVSKNIGLPMKGIEISAIPETQRLQTRGW